MPQIKAIRTFMDLTRLVPTCAVKNCFVSPDASVSLNFFQDILEFEIFYINCYFCLGIPAYCLIITCEK